MLRWSAFPYVVEARGMVEELDVMLAERSAASSEARLLAAPVTRPARPWLVLVN